MLKLLPGILGALLVVVGSALVAWPLGLVALGLLLLAVDRRIA